MPTGYTAKVHSGEIASLEAFALLCARAFLVSLREQPLDAPLPPTIEPSPFYKQKVEELCQQLGELTAMSAAQQLKFATDALARREREHAASVQEYRDETLRIDRLTKQVKAWVAPAEHTPLKAFMLEQLRITRGHEPLPLEFCTPEDWMRTHLASIRKYIQWYQDKRAAEVERAVSATSWLDALRESLKEKVE